MKQILKWDVPVDGQRYLIGAGPVVHAASQYGLAQVIQVWTEEPMGAPNRVEAEIVGTGHTYPDEGVAEASVLTAGGHLVWHVVRYPQG